MRRRTRVARSLPIALWCARRPPIADAFLVLSDTIILLNSYPREALVRSIVRSHAALKSYS